MSAADIEHEGRLSDMETQRAEIRELRAEIERLRAALAQLVIDYEDVPDPTDADGQAVFERARALLTPGRKTG